MQDWRHFFFADLDWHLLEARAVEPPFKPKVDNEMQTHMFESEFTDQTPKDTPIIKTGSMLKAQGAFPGFTFDHTKDSALNDD